MKDQIEMKKVAVYIPEEDYRLIRAKLISRNRSFSGWIRLLIKEYLREDRNA